MRAFRLPASTGYANLNTATFDRRGVLWFTGQSGFYGRLDPKTGAMRVFRAPGGTGPYGITTTPKGDVWYASLAGSHIARIDVRTGQGDRRPAADRGPGRAARLVGLARADLGERVERRQGRALRPGDPQVAGVARPRAGRRPTPSTWTTRTPSG